MARTEVPLLTKKSSPSTDLLPVDLHLNRQGGAPLHTQLAEQLRQGVLSGALPADLRLPGSRPLATSLGVTRGVVAEAYAELVAEGTLSAAVGSGTRVPRGAVQAVQKRVGSAPGWFVPPPPLPIDHTGRLPGIHFKTGVTTSATLDEKAWRQAWAYAARQGIRGDYSAVAGEDALRGALAAFVGRSRGLLARPEDVLVTAGTLQGLNLVERLLPRGSIILLENPGYRAARQVFLDSGHTALPLPLDEDGPVISPDLPPAHAVYVTPSHQFPLGVRMSLPRRLALLDWAEANDALIIEDDYDGEFRYGAPPLPPLASLDRAGRVLYLASLSKVLTPSVRTGFLITSPALIPALVRARTLLDSGHPVPVQQALSFLLNRGELDRHIRRTRRWHAQVREALTRELAPLEPLATLRGIEAGLHVCLHLAPGLRARKVQRELAQAQVYVSTLGEYGQDLPEALLLGYGDLTLAQAVAGAQIIVKVLRALA
ncbi:PLP-dependent aminotransferase family protein [Deinococcus sp.]|uniref:MocR-like pyridoxine biosynthesis transcription factor PdxR n=1 Tax=Deinococcus sp. TaxID=47478 RepID=UPI0025BC966B|nr:PLP-dependent aminotransferase family protein [Deinococcus sp.]